MTRITPGKCSPEGVFLEYKYTREIAAAVVQHLQYQGFDAALVTPEEYDLSLRARTERVNTWCLQLGKRNVCLISGHNRPGAVVPSQASVPQIREY